LATFLPKISKSVDVDVIASQSSVIILRHSVYKMSRNMVLTIHKCTAW